MELNSIPFIFLINSIHSLHRLFSKFSSVYQHDPLVSTVVTLYTLILLYLPSLFFTILLSPVLNSTGIILLSLLRLGALQQEVGILEFIGNESLEDESSYLEPRDLYQKDDLTLYSGLALDPSSTESVFLDSVELKQADKEESKLKTGFGHACDQTHSEFDPKYDLDMECNHIPVELKHDVGLESNSIESSQVLEGGGTKEGMDPKQVETGTMAFLEWKMRAPLEIIYEAYEGEEEDEEENNENNEDIGNKQTVGFERHPSLSMCYPDSETDSSSDDDFPMNVKWVTHESVFFRWEEEEEREELIEISLDRYGKRRIDISHPEPEEDNLIEIDISRARN